LLWAALFHDLTKRGSPRFEGKDHIHPFTSAAMFIDILRVNKMFGKEVEDQHSLKVVDLIN